MAECSIVRALHSPALLLLVVLACPATVPGSAFAVPGKAPHRSLEALRSELSTGDVDAVGTATDGLIAMGSERAAAALSDFVHLGQPDALTDRVLERLVEAPFPAALPLLAELTRHRRAGVRRMAYSALARLEARKRAPRVDAAAVDAMLAEGLRDSDAGVRGRCARALGERGAVAQLDTLFRALERGVPEAGAAIGRIGDSAALARFHTHVGTRPIDVMLAGYEQFLARAELGEADKLDIVARLGEVASPTVKHFLGRLLASTDWPPKSRLRHAVYETERRIDGGKRPEGARDGR